MLVRLILILSLFFFQISHPNNIKEISGNFVFDVDSKKNELYVFNSNLELKTYDIDSGELLNSFTIPATKTSNTSNRAWYGLFSRELNLTSDILENLLEGLTLKKSGENNFYLFHNGGGLVIKFNDKGFHRVDNSFPFMNKFGGDIIFYNDKIFNFGGYGLFRTNNTMLSFDEGNSNQWDEIKYVNGIPKELNYGLKSFFSLLIESNYYILDGNSNFNNEINFNKSILRFDFEDYSWKSLGEVNLDLSSEPLIIPSESYYYIFHKDFFYHVQIENKKILRFNYLLNFDIENLGDRAPSGKNPNSFISISPKDELFGNLDANEYNNKSIVVFKPHNSKYNTSILNKYPLEKIIDINSAVEIPLFKVEQSRNQFFIPILIVFVIIIVNLLYQGIKKDVKEANMKLFTFEQDELFFLETKINMDNNSLEILKMLQENEYISSNDIVAKLVDNGLSYDYASKVKNKIVESLNEKFEFITGSELPFINISKSPQDKRIQILSILKN